MAAVSPSGTHLCLHRSRRSAAVVGQYPRQDGVMTSKCGSVMGGSWCSFRACVHACVPACALMRLDEAAHFSSFSSWLTFFGSSGRSGSPPVRSARRTSSELPFAIVEDGAGLSGVCPWNRDDGLIFRNVTGSVNGYKWVWAEVLPASPSCTSRDSLRTTDRAMLCIP